MATEKKEPLKLITGAAELDKLSKKLATDIRNQDKAIHVYLLSEIAHIEEHRNPTRLNVFFSAIKGSGARVNAMMAFIEVFGCVKFNTSPDVMPDNKEAKVWFSMRPARKTYKFWDSKAREWQFVKTFQDLLVKAQERPWWGFKPEPEPTAYVMADKFGTFMKGIFTALNTGNKDNVIPVAMVADLAALAKKHGIDVGKLVPENFTPPAELKAVIPVKKSETTDDKPETKSTTVAKQARTPRVTTKPAIQAGSAGNQGAGGQVSQAAH